MFLNSAVTRKKEHDYSIFSNSKTTVSKCHDCGMKGIDGEISTLKIGIDPIPIQASVNLPIFSAGLQTSLTANTKVIENHITTKECTSPK